MFSMLHRQHFAGFDTGKTHRFRNLEHRSWRGECFGQFADPWGACAFPWVTFRILSDVFETHKSKQHPHFQSTSNSTISVADWWFGRFFMTFPYFPIILGMSSSQLTHIFQRGSSYTTNQGFTDSIIVMLEFTKARNVDVVRGISVNRCCRKFLYDPLFIQHSHGKWSVYRCLLMIYKLKTVIYLLYM